MFLEVQGVSFVLSYLRLHLHQGRGRDPAHERAPGPRILTPSRVPAQHAIGCLGDEDHGVWAQVDAVDEDDLMNLIDDRAERP